MNCSPPGPSVHGILQARVLEWAAIPFSRKSASCYLRCHLKISSAQSLSCVWLFATPWLPVCHQFPELAQTHVHQVSDAIQSSLPLSVLSSRLQSVPASGSLPVSQFFKSSGQSIGASSSALVLPLNIQCWFPLGWTGWVSLQSKGLSRVSCNITVQKHQFFSAQLSL